MSKLELPSVGEFLLKPGTEPISNTLLAFLRVFSMRKAELAHWLRSDKVFDLEHVDCALETVVEENVRKFLLTRLQLLIANYPTTLKVKVKSDVALSAFHIDRSRLISMNISFFFYAGRSRVTGDHVTADEKDDGSTEGYGKKNSFGRARICGAVD